MGHRVCGFLRIHKPRLAVGLLCLGDVAVLLAAVAIAFTLRFDSTPYPVVYREHIAPHRLTLLIAVLMYLPAFAGLRLYRYAWRFAGLETLWSVVCANTLGIAGLFVLQRLVDGGTFPRSVLIMTWAGGIIFVGGSRILLRVLLVASRRGASPGPLARRGGRAKRAVILGAGDTGARTLKACLEDPNLDYDVVGFLDDDPCKHGVYIGSVKVLGSVDTVKHLVTRNAVDEVIVALPGGCGQKIRECVMDCRKRRVPVKVVPQLKEVLGGDTRVELADFSVEDLLRRSPVTTQVVDVGAYLRGRRVLVTGAGGSIGSELCRQILSFEPASLVLLGHGENSIYGIHNELVSEHQSAAQRIHRVIASVTNRSRISQVFNCYRPQIVFHAAAHKHLPMMETNEHEAVYNNVLGTNCVARACGEFGVERMVLISSDKAADPACVMGATKWLCEEVMRACGSLWPATSYVAARFGNVLGSRGSVVPLFHDQIRRGGPVTVTHPEMTRYFMIIPEAVRLVLQAGAVGESRELYLLDMGDPVKIVDLARDMICLCGLEPHVDIDIIFTGVRPGEKLHERLASESERLENTPWKGLSIIRRPDYYTASQFEKALVRIEHVAGNGSGAEVRQVLDELVCRPETPLTQPVAEPAPRPTYASEVI